MSFPIFGANAGVNVTPVIDKLFKLESFDFSSGDVDGGVLGSLDGGVSGFVVVRYEESI